MSKPTSVPRTKARRAAHAGARRRAPYLGPVRRRPQVLEAAAAAFSQGTFTETSMASIAARLGVSKAVLYDCFPGGKQQILNELLGNAEAVFLDHMGAVLDVIVELPIEHALRLTLSSFLGYVRADPQGFRLIFHDTVAADGSVAESAARARERMVARLVDATARNFTDTRRGPARLGGVYSRLFLAVIEELGHLALEDPAAPREELVDSVVRWWVGGLMALMKQGELPAANVS